MRPAHLVALLAGVLLLGAIVILTAPGAPEPLPPAPPAPPAPNLTPRGAGTANDAEQRERVLDEVEEREAAEYGKAEAARRRNYREQLLDQRPSPSD